MVTATDKRDAEIFKQISALMAGVSVKNKKNLNDLMATYMFKRSWTEEVEKVFERAARYANGDREDKEWYY